MLIDIAMLGIVLVGCPPGNVGGDEGIGEEGQGEPLTIEVPGAEIIVAGDVFQETATVDSMALVGIVKDGEAFLYHPSMGEVDLSEEGSRRAVGYWIYEQFLDSEKQITGTVELETGIDVSPAGSASYEFENGLKRWAAVVSEAEGKPKFLAPRGSLVDINILDALTGTGDLVTFLQRDSDEILVGPNPVPTYGAITRIPLWPFLVGAAVIDKDDKGLLDQVQALRTSVNEAIERDSFTFIRLNAIDQMTFIIDGVAAISGLFPGECADAVIDGVILSTIESALLALITQDDEIAGEAFRDTIEGFGVSAASCAASEGTGVGVLVSIFVDIVAAINWIIDDHIIGSLTAAGSLAFDEVEGIEEGTGQPEGEGEPASEGAGEGEPVGCNDCPSETFILPGNVALEMIGVSAGTFLMGSADSGRSDEIPVHSVTLTQNFQLGKFEVTKAQWTAVMDTTPWSGLSFVLDDPNTPATHVSWNDVQTFVTTLNGITGETFRLPTEAEWEYACRAGTTTEYYFGDSSANLGDYAWYSENAHGVGEDYAHVVGQLLPNAFGLFDMHGNAWEWCSDWYGSSYYSSSPSSDPTGPTSGSIRVACGGGWISAATGCRPANRDGLTPAGTTGHLGFRLAR